MQPEKFFKTNVHKAMEKCKRKISVKEKKNDAYKLGEKLEII